MSTKSKTVPVVVPPPTPVIPTQAAKDHKLANEIVALLIKALINNQINDNSKIITFIKSKDITQNAFNVYLNKSSKASIELDFKNLLIKNNITDAKFKSWISNKIDNGLKNTYAYFNKEKALGFTLNDAIAEATKFIFKDTNTDPNTIVDLAKKMQPKVLATLENLLEFSKVKNNPILFSLPNNEMVSQIVINNLSSIMQQVITKKTVVEAVLINPNNNISFDFDSRVNELIDNFYPSVLSDIEGDVGFVDLNTNIQMTKKLLTITIPKNTLNSLGEPSISYFVPLETNL